MSSTRDTLSGVREDTAALALMRHQLKEAQEMIQDLQQLAAINREAVSLFADNNSTGRDKVVQSLRNENTLLFRALLRSIGAQRRLEVQVG